MQQEQAPPQSSSPPQIHGDCDPRFVKLSSALRDFIASDVELGASISVTIDGVCVVNIWGGHVDAARVKPWEKNTIANVFSCSKTITAIAALLLIDRGLISLDDPVAKHWPEFAANGKEGVLIRHLFSHTSGLPGWDEPVSFAGLEDVKGMTAKLAEQAPWWTPGTASGYHALTYGHLLGEVVRRVSGKSLTDFIRYELALPLGVDFQLGAAEHDWERIAPIEMARREKPPELPPPALDSVGARVWSNPLLVTVVDDANTPAWRRSEIGSANGHSNARALARMLSVLANDGKVDKNQILRRETVELILEEQISGKDLVIGLPLRFGVGFSLTGEGGLLDYIPEGRIGFWGGFGGSVALVDLERRMSMSYVMNRASLVSIGSERTRSYVKAVYEALGVKTGGDAGAGTSA